MIIRNAQGDEEDEKYSPDDNPSDPDVNPAIQLFLPIPRLKSATKSIAGIYVIISIIIVLSSQQLNCRHLDTERGWDKINAWVLRRTRAHLLLPDLDFGRPTLIGWPIYHLILALHLNSI